MALMTDRPLRRRLAAAFGVFTLFAACSSSPGGNGSSVEQTPAATAAPPAESTSAGPHLVNGKTLAAVGGFPSVLILEAQSAQQAPPPGSPYMDQVQQT